MYLYVLYTSVLPHVIYSKPQTDLMPYVLFIVNLSGMYLLLLSTSVQPSDDYMLCIVNLRLPYDVLHIIYMCYILSHVKPQTDLMTYVLFNVNLSAETSCCI